MRRSRRPLLLVCLKSENLLRGSQTYSSQKPPSKHLLIEGDGFSTAQNIVSAHRSNVAKLDGARVNLRASRTRTKEPLALGTAIALGHRCPRRSHRPTFPRSIHGYVLLVATSRPVSPTAATSLV
eukprot:SAG25_NODE_811_length_5236_cov_107.100253_2_plen_125_part_00